LPSGSGIHVPAQEQRQSQAIILGADLGRTLILPVPALHLLVDARLHLALEDAGPRGLVIVGYLEDVGRIDPVVGAASHDMIRADGVLIDRHLCLRQRQRLPGTYDDSHCCR
jgi:hypothetical protein